jgi:hypothetical protein
MSVSCSTSRRRRIILIIYEILVGLLFTAHLVTFVVVLMAKPRNELLYKPYTRFIERSVAHVNAEYNTPSYTGDMSGSSSSMCDMLKLVSTLGKCCDFVERIPRAACCINTTTLLSTDRCVDATAKFFFESEYFDYWAVRPTVSLLVLEAVLLILAPFLYGRRYDNRYNTLEERYKNTIIELIQH